MPGIAHDHVVRLDQMAQRPEGADLLVDARLDRTAAQPLGQRERVALVALGLA
jgi:hypothetical protein